MKRTFLGGLLVASSMVVGSYLTASPPAKSAPPPATTYQRGPFQPLARVNPGKPVRVKLTNKASVPVDYIIVTYTNSRRLAPGQTAQLSGFPLPAYLNINPTRDRIAVQYGVSVDAKTNTAIVEIQPSSSGGERSLNIDATGAIYAF